MQGNDGIHRVAYAKKGSIDAGEKEKEKAALLEAYVEKGGQKVIVSSK